jgi:hypothetical protein
MNKNQRLVVFAICLLLSVTPITPIKQIWANSAPQLITEQTAVTLLLDGDEVEQVSLTTDIQNIIGLLLTDDEDEQRVFLPLIDR